MDRSEMLWQAALFMQASYDTRSCDLKSSRLVMVQYVPIYTVPRPCSVSVIYRELRHSCIFWCS